MQSVDFSLPIFVDGGTVLVRSNAKILRLADLKGRKVAVIGGTTSERALKQRARRPPARRRRWSRSRTPARAWRSSRAARWTAMPATATVLAMLRAGATDSGAYTFIEGDFSVEPYALMLPRNDADFRLAVNRALVALFRSGEIDLDLPALAGRPRRARARCCTR